jgi:hypothetical protein
MLYLDFSLERNQPTQSSIHVLHNYNDRTTTHHLRQDNISGKNELLNHYFTIRDRY